MLAAGLASTVMLVAGCAETVVGTATWPGAVLDRALLTESDFPSGVQYDRIVEQPGRPDGAGGPGAMLSRPPGCSDALTNVIKQSAERGPGSAAKYAATYDGARIAMTLLSWNLDMAALAAAAERCASFEAFFDPASEGVPIRTTELSGLEREALAYQQTMELGDAPSSVYMAFQNVGRRAVFGLAFPVKNPRVEAKAALPQTFLEVFNAQVVKLRAS